MDDYKDIDELCAGDEDDGEFEAAAKHVQTLAAKLEEASLLSLYGYYKQASLGNCNVPRPGWMDFKGKAKWDAWEKMKDMPQAEARQQYINLVAKLDPNYRTQDKTKKAAGWVTVSTLQPSEPEPSTNDDDDEEALRLIKCGDAVALKRLLDENKCENINGVDGSGMALIHWAADRGFVDILDVLCRHGADVDCSDVDQQTPLHYASSCGYLKCVQYLVQNGASVDVRDNEGLKPVDVAADDEIRNYLLHGK